MRAVLPNQSPEPTAVVAAVAIHAASRRWLSFSRSATSTPTPKLSFRRQNRHRSNQQHKKTMKTLIESTLPPPQHISDVEPRTEKDDALFAELAAVLKKHDALDRFGVNLLHRHFDLAPGEFLLETTNIPTRLQTIEPIREQDLNGEEVIETAWRLGDGWIAMGCVCVKMGSDHQHQSRGDKPVC
jgi:hypothetical protein